MAKVVIDYIDILDIYTNWDTARWNAFLTDCIRKNDIKKLVDTRIQLQYGMDRLVKEKLNTDKIAQLFIRLTRSIEKTLQKIHRIKNPNPNFNPLTASGVKEVVKDKKKKDQEFEAFLRKQSY